MSNNIVLIGYRGTGKSSTGKALAALLGKEYVSVDAELEKEIDSITDYVGKNGWEAFRDKEHELLASLFISNTVIDCGGGIIEREDNHELLRKLGNIIWLTADVHTIASRIKDNNQRPSLTPHKSPTEEIEEVLAKRTQVYKKLAQITVDTNKKTPEEVAQELAHLFSNTHIVASIIGKTVDEMKKSMELATDADVIELRLDTLDTCTSSDIDALLSTGKKPIMITIRSSEQGGSWSGSEEGRRKLIEHAIDNNVDYIDLEFQSDKGLAQSLGKRKPKMVVSHHIVEKTPSLRELEQWYTEMNELRPHLVKIVTKANSVLDTFTIYELLKNKQNVVAFCMGEKGQSSRVLCAKYGSVFTYGSVENEAAPGQLPVNDLRNKFRMQQITENTQLFGVIGTNVEHSLSPTIHNLLCSKHSIDAVYVPFHVEEHELEDFLIQFKKMSWNGLSVTIPHKETAVNFVDSVDESAQSIGALNTITLSSSKKLMGTNTDYIGAVEALKEKTELSGKKVLVLGAGGASRAIVYALVKEGATVCIANRSEEKAKQLAKEFDTDCCSLEINKKLMETDLVINTTSVGMNTQETLINKELIRKDQTVMDMVYMPKITQLLTDAQHQGATIITGDRMLLYQAIEQFRLWTEKQGSIQEIEQFI